MRIGIDARFFGKIGKGLGRYTQKLIENLENIDSSNEYFIFLRRENWNEYQPRKGNFAKVLADIPWYSFREQIAMPRIMNRCGLDLAHFPHFNVPVTYQGKFVVTIHDLILFKHPTKRATQLSPLIYFLKKNAYYRVIKRAVLKSEKIIAVSHHTKRDILEHFPVRSNKIAVTYEAVDTCTGSPIETTDSILRKYGIMKPYVLYVGNAYPHKNLERLVLAFKEVVKKHPDLSLVLAGKRDYFFKQIENFVAKKSIPGILFPEHIEEIHLPTVYREAKLYVFPSLYEGFGLPPLEAMSQGTPVACSNTSCLPEILGNAAYFFDPRGITETAEAIENMLTNIQLRKKLIEAGKIQIRKYSWKKMAAETLDIYRIAQLNHKRQ